MSSKSVRKKPFTTTNNTLIPQLILLRPPSEHHNSTDLTLVGLQVWRGALLLADYCLHERQLFRGKRVMELGTGVGLTGIAAAMYADRVICTDINLGGILELIGSNIRRNKRLLTSTTPATNMSVMELDFMKTASWSTELLRAIDETDVFLVADVIYDDELTDAFLTTIDVLLSRGGGKTMYIALEKRYVFTLADLESLAPCYEYFLTGMDRLRRRRPQWRFDAVPVDFAQFFEYERVKELVLLRLRSE